MKKLFFIVCGLFLNLNLVSCPAEPVPKSIEATENSDNSEDSLQMPFEQGDRLKLNRDSVGD